MRLQSYLRERWYSWRVDRFFGPTALVYRNTTWIAFESGSITRIIDPVRLPPADAWKWIWRNRHRFIRPLFKGLGDQRWPADHGRK